MAGQGNSLRVVVTALIANGLIAVSKFLVWAVSGSSAMLAESLHSVADTGNQVLILVGIRRARKPPDQVHPYGYGKETYFWSFVVAISIFTLGAAFSLYEGIHKIIELRHLEQMPTLHHAGWAVGVLLVGLVVEGYSLWVAVREFQREAGGRGFRQTLRETRSAALVTVLFEDTAAVLGLAVALVGVSLSWITGNLYHDAIATLCISAILGGVAVFLGFMTKRLLIGQSASPAVEEEIAEAIHGTEGVVAIVELKTLHMGANFILLNLALKFAPGLTTSRLEAVIDRVETRVKQAIPEVKRIFVEVESFRGTGSPDRDGPES